MPTSSRDFEDNKVTRGGWDRYSGVLGLPEVTTRILRGALPEQGIQVVALVAEFRGAVLMMATQANKCGVLTGAPSAAQLHAVGSRAAPALVFAIFAANLTVRSISRN